MADKTAEKNKKSSEETLALSSEKQKEFEEKVKKIKPKDSDGELVPGVVYLGHIPHGFYENEIRNFFEQFGTVNRVRLSRSKKSARSKGYAFIEFDCDEVAKIAAETMDNYMMFGRLLKCKVISPDKIHPRLWEGSNRKFRHVSRNEIAIKKQNKERNQKEHAANVKNILKKESRKRKKLEKLGIAYDFPGYKEEAEESQPKHKRFSDE
ncbi:MKI67 FHA domain-interacting nucleolar phosphoprotein-like [Actinia tenebrosa]|uniref:MKI67 FHA domain-interacting nucleolar phosphoprotein-like n=1 Tax=Actinia tenebrosa TaxID=6105 RepID=A0A6P8HJS9_ACTTE|nr:MKI67 FHA domain-interacting nucleolar phosphoprotein-like [Actinia tenebrosa]